MEHLQMLRLFGSSIQITYRFRAARVAIAAGQRFTVKQRGGLLVAAGIVSKVLPS
jgi:translation elongation factor EF-Tu-like GTPase